MSSKTSKLEILEAQINTCRHYLTTLCESRGCTDPEVLAAGVKLDKLLNKYYKLQNQVKID